MSDIYFNGCKCPFNYCYNLLHLVDSFQNHLMHLGVFLPVNLQDSHFTQGTLNKLLPNLLYIANHSAQERSETLQYVFNFYICKHPKWLNWRGKKTKGTLLLFFCFCLKPSSYSKADQYINCATFGALLPEIWIILYMTCTQGSPTQLFLSHPIRELCGCVQTVFDWHMCDFILSTATVFTLLPPSLYSLCRY